jgi:hypothetical protein
MATKSVDVDIDLSDFDTNEILSELEDRYKSKYITEKQKQEIYEFAEEIVPAKIKIVSLADKMKLEHIEQCFDKYSLEEIQTLLSK